MLEGSTAPKIRQIEEIDERQVYVTLFTECMESLCSKKKKICCAAFKNISTYNVFTIEYLGREVAFYI